MNKDIYVHLSGDHNMEAPNQIVPLLHKYFAPASVVDYGCGIGNFLYKFKEYGVSKILGIDGPWCKNDLQMLQDGELAIRDLKEDLGLNEKFDLAISFEVAEHLDSQYADKIIKDLTSLADVVIFSAALPGQGGQNHVNEQWPEYWVKRFKDNGYTCFDALRPLLWNTANIQFWYKQNMFVAIRSTNTEAISTLKDSFPYINDMDNTVNSIIHPHLLDLKIKRIDRLVRMFKGKASLEEYKMELMKPFTKKYK